MSSQTVLEFRAGQLPIGSNPSYLVRGNVVSICECPAYSKPSKDQMIDSDPDGLGCVRGVRAALFLELSAGVVAYGIWHLWHILR